MSEWIEELKTNFKHLNHIEGDPIKYDSQENPTLKYRLLKI